MPASIVTYLQINPKLTPADVLVFAFPTCGHGEGEPEAAHVHDDETYAVTDAYCIQPSCDCKLASLKVERLMDEPGMRDPDPAWCFLHLETLALVDAHGQTVVAPPGSLLERFHRQMPAGGLELWRKHYQQARAFGKQNYWKFKDFSDLEPGSMVAWTEIYEDAPIPSVQEGGQRFAVVDRYCPSPVCHCHEAVLSFVLPSGPSIQGDEPEATVRVGFKGQLEIEDAGPLPEAHVEKLVRAYLKDHRRMKELKSRYQEMKRVGKVLGERYPTLAQGWGLRMAPDFVDEDDGPTAEERAILQQGLSASLSAGLTGKPRKRSS